MKELGIDIETYSSNDLTECGVYKYVEAEDFTILLFAYSVDGGPVQCVDLASGETLPPEIKAALTDPEVIKTAFNAAFERICIGVFRHQRAIRPETMAVYYGKSRPNGFAAFISPMWRSA